MSAAPSKPHTVARYLLALAAVESVRGLVLSATEKVLIARMRLWAEGRDGEGVRGGRLLNMSAEHRADFERLVRSRTGKDVADFEPTLAED